MQHFINGQSQNVAVHRGDPVQFPILRVLFDAIVHLFQVLQRATNQRVGKQPNRLILFRGCQWIALLSPGSFALVLGDGCRAL